LVLGGSLGARRINQLIEKELTNIQSQNVQGFGKWKAILKSIKKYILQMFKF
jgi:UDP-N-acetylglucosamine--N-acetylmuramyl-(pentapeptide) pyrophosphoryl-undecaprenol N-acetylglucosamine transferase